MTSNNGPPTPSPLVKHRSWSPDSDREESWIRRQSLHSDRRRGRLCRSVTDEDVDELRGCFDLGFGFQFKKEGGTPDRLSDAFPALDLYYAVHRHYEESEGSDSRSSPSSSISSPLSIYNPGDSPHEVKARLKQWAQVVACSLRQLS